MTNMGTGHPLPASEEARTGELPEHLVEEKGEGGDSSQAIQPAAGPVAPDGEAYALERDHAAPQNLGRPGGNDPGRG